MACSAHISAFVQEARAAQQQTNNYRLDKSHSFVVNMFDDFDKYNKVPEEYAPPEKKAYEPQVSRMSLLGCQKMSLHGLQLCETKDGC